MAPKKATANYSLFRDLRRFGVEALCLLMLLYGSPLQALESVTEPQRADAAEESTTQDEPSWVEPVLETAGHTFDAVQDEVRQLAVDVASQPWTDAFGLLFTASHVGASGAGSSSSSAPPSPPKDDARPSKDYDLASLAAGFTEKNALDAVPLLPGWNQVSLPEVPSSSDPATVLAAIGGSYHKVYTYNGCDAADPWKVYDPNDLAASDLTAIGVEQGLLINATAAVSLPSDGTLPDTTTIQLCTGWNLIGFPSVYPRHVKSTLAPILDKVVRVYAFDPFDLADNWKFYEASAPAWASDLDTMLPGMGYWVLVTEDVQLEIKNVGDAPSIAFTSPQDLDVITAPTEIQGTVASDLLDNWQLRYRAVGENDWVELATGNYPVQGKLGDFDPTLLLNGMYELEQVATDLQGQQVSESIAIVVEGNMKIGHFTLSFVDLAIPLSGLDIQVVRTYDSRQRHLQGDFGYGWTLDIRQGSYRNNRPPGDGWRIPPTEGPWGLPCSTVQELKSHLTTVRLSDQEVYRFRLTVKEPGTIIGGCIGRAEFEFVDGPVPGATLEILGNDSVLYQNNSDELRDPNSFALFVPEDVKLTTRDGRIFHLDLVDGVTHLEDLNGNTLEITPEGITHSSGRGVEFERDAEGRIERIIDPMGNANVYAYDAAGDHVSFIDRIGAVTTFAYADGHYLEDIVNALGVRAVRTEYDDEGRMVRVIDAAGKVVALDHDLDARREVITNRLGFVRVMEYDGRGNVVREVDELGNATVRTYDSKGRLLSETNPLDETVSYTYDANGFLTSTRDPLGNTTSYTYDLQGNPTTITDPRSKVTSSTYDARGNLTTIVDPMGATATLAYDARGQMTSQTDALGSETTFVYDSAGHLTRAGNLTSQTHWRTLPDGSSETLTTIHSLDDLGRVTQTTFPDGSTTQTNYDSIGSVVSTVDALGHTTQFRYDAAGQQIETLFADGTLSSRSYDAEGRVVAITDRGGRVTTMAYDPAGRLVSTLLADGSTASSTYDSAGRVLTSTDPRGATTAYSYDSAGRRTKVVDALGHATTYVYDSVGNQVRKTDASGHSTEFSYDDTGRLVSTTWADGALSRTEYDVLGRRVAEVDQAGVRTKFAYDALSHLIQVKDALGGITLYTYDEQGNRISQTDANGRTTRFNFDTLGRQVGRTLPDGSHESFVYDGNGHRIERTSFDGATTTYAYDVNGRLTQRSYSDGTVEVTTYTPNGQRASVTDARGVTSYTYDERDRLTSMSSPEGWTLRYGWDPTGNRTALTIDLGPEVPASSTTTTYDALGRIETVTDAKGRIYRYSYDEVSRRASLSFPNGVETTYSLDPIGRLQRLHSQAADGTVIQDYAYGLGPTGIRQSVIEEDGTLRSWAYDSLYRLTRERVTDGTGNLEYENIFTYDSVGNRLQQERVSADGTSESIAYTYDERDRLLMEPSSINGTKSYGWDANGNRTSKSEAGGTTTFTWDAENRLAAISLPEGTVVGNVYDVDGVRMISSVTEPGTQTRTIRHVTDSSGPLSQVVARATELGDIEEQYVRGGELLGVWGEDSERYVHGDHVGSARALTDHEARVQGAYSFGAFGDLSREIGETLQDLGFLGEPGDKEANLVYLRARWMPLGSGRFLNEDPFLGEPIQPASLHRFLYAENDPIGKMDPSGRFTSVQSFAISGAISGALFGGIEAYLTPNASVLEGVVLGGFLGAALGPLASRALKAGGFAARALVAGGLGLGTYGVWDAYSSGHQALAFFRAVTLVGGLAGAVGLRLSAVARQQQIQRLRATLLNVLRQRAGFAVAGRPVIIDTSIGVSPARVAGRLRAAGINARTVPEVFGTSRIDDADILSVAELLDGVVVASDRGRQLGGGFFTRTVQVPNRVREVDTAVRLILANPNL